MFDRDRRIHFYAAAGKVAYHGFRTGALFAVVSHYVKYDGYRAGKAEGIAALHLFPVAY
jgi:hypothetical protein